LTQFRKYPIIELSAVDRAADTKKIAGFRARQSEDPAKLTNPAKGGKEFIMLRTAPNIPRRPAAIRLTYEQGCWIKYQLNLRNIAYRTVAHEARLHEKTIADFVNGRNHSENCAAALCKVLGAASLAALFANMPKGGKA
jgi:hypothetical protein